MRNEKKKQEEELGMNEEEGDKVVSKPRFVNSGFENLVFGIK